MLAIFCTSGLGAGASKCVLVDSFALLWPCQPDRNHKYHDRAKKYAGKISLSFLALFKVPVVGGLYANRDT